MLDKANKNKIVTKDFLQKYQQKSFQTISEADFNKLSQEEKDCGITYYIYDKEVTSNGNIALTATLARGETTVTFTDTAITPAATVDFYTSKYGVSPTDVSIEGNTCTVTFKAQNEDIQVKVVIS